MAGQSLDLSNEEYHKLPAIGSTGLKELSKSPRHFWEKFINPDRDPFKTTASMELGTAIHCAFLEPDEFPKRYRVAPEKVTRRHGAFKDWERELTAEGIKLLTEEDEEKVWACSRALDRHPWIARLLEVDGFVEGTFVWEMWGLRCKIRTDLLVEPCHQFPRGLVFDVKSTKDASPEGFQRTIWNFRYDIQAAWYALGFMVKYRTKVPPEFVFGAVETSEPFLAAPYKASDDMIQAGFKEIQRLIPVYKHCLATNNWPGYSDDLMELNLPYWAQKKIGGFDE